MSTRTPSREYIADQPHWCASIHGKLDERMNAMQAAQEERDRFIQQTLAAHGSALIEIKRDIIEGTRVGEETRDEVKETNGSVRDLKRRVGDLEESDRVTEAVTAALGAVRGARRSLVWRLVEIGVGAIASGALVLEVLSQLGAI